MGFEVSGYDIADGTEIVAKASIQDDENVGMYESWTCKATY